MGNLAQQWVPVLRVPTAWLAPTHLVEELRHMKRVLHVQLGPTHQSLGLVLLQLAPNAPQGLSLAKLHQIPAAVVPWVRTLTLKEV